MSVPMFPNLTPRLTDVLWFGTDKPCDDESELAALEEDQRNWMRNIAEENFDVPPIGRTASAPIDEEEDDDDDEDDNDDDTDSHDDEDDEDLDMEVSYGRESPVDVSIHLPSGTGHGVR